MTQHTLENYDPHAHLVKIKGKDGSEKEYYPAAWRLVELRLKHPHITIESEILHLDPEHNFVIIKAWIFDGKTYAESDHRASGTKQGLLSALDKVETAAKARAARDFGVSTELALDMDEDITPAAGQASTAESLATIKAEVKAAGLARNPQQWQAWKKTILGHDLPDAKLTAGQITKLKACVDQCKKEKSDAA